MIQNGDYLTSPASSSPKDIAIEPGYPQPDPLLSDRLVAYFFRDDGQIIEKNPVTQFSNLAEYYKNAMESYTGQKMAPDKSFSLPSPQRTEELNYYLQGTPDRGTVFNLRLTSSEIAECAKFSWHVLEHVNSLIHRPTFDLEKSNPVLAATIVYIGLVTKSADKKQYEPCYRGLVHHVRNGIYWNRNTKMSIARENLPFYQSLGLLGWYNYNLAYRDNDSPAFFPYVEDVRQSLLPYRFLGGPLEGDSSESRPVIILDKARADSEAFTFFDDANSSPNDYWQCWIFYESLTRLAHFLTDLESGRNFTMKSPINFHFLTTNPVLISPLALWTITTPEWFMYTVGPSRSIPNISLMSTIRSMLRLPRIGTEVTELNGCWTISHLYILLYALATVGWFVEKGGIADVNVKCRVAHGFETWAQYAAKTQYAHHAVQGYNSGLSSIQSDCTPEKLWDGITSICTIFQTTYYSFYRHDEFEIEMAAHIIDNLELYAQVKSTLAEPENEDHIEMYAMFGTLTPAIEQWESLERWPNRELVCNRITVAAYYLLNLINSRSPSVLSGVEVVYAKRLLVPTCLSLWAYNFHKRALGMKRSMNMKEANQSKPAQTVRGEAESKYFKSCIQDPKSVDTSKIMAYFQAILINTYNTTIDPWMRKHELPLKLIDTKVCEEWGEFKLIGNIITFLSAISIMDEKLKPDSSCAPMELLEKARRALF